MRTKVVGWSVGWGGKRRVWESEKNNLLVAALIGSLKCNRTWKKLGAVESHVVPFQRKRKTCRLAMGMWYSGEKNKI